MERGADGLLALLPHSTFLIPTVMKLTVYTRTGAEAGREIELDDAVFGIEPNDHAIWLDVRAIQAHMRQGTHKTKERAEVSKSTRKLYRQKGTGNARAGSAKSPTRKGGGTIFGPKPHEYNVRVNRKTKQLARRSALAYKITAGGIRVMENLTLDAPKTRTVAEALTSNGISGRVLILTNGMEDVLYRSARNVPGVEVCDAAQASTLDLMRARTILLQEGAVEALTSALRASGKDDATETAAPLPAKVEKAPKAPKAAPAEAPAAEAPAAEAPAAETKADDLTKVWGIGPVFSEALVSEGITTFAALAATDLETLRGIITSDTNASEASANEESWAEQARLLDAGDTAAFDAYVDTLRAGDSDDSTEA